MMMRLVKSCSYKDIKFLVSCNVLAKIIAIFYLFEFLTKDDMNKLRGYLSSGALLASTCVLSACVLSAMSGVVAA